MFSNQHLPFLATALPMPSSFDGISSRQLISRDPAQDSLNQYTSSDDASHLASVPFFTVPCGNSEVYVLVL